MRVVSGFEGRSWRKAHRAHYVDVTYMLLLSHASLTSGGVNILP